ncbi:MAG: response regulator [Sphingobacteriaceae bacterium]
MTKLFNKLSFSTKLGLLGLIPLIFLTYFSIEIIQEKQERAKIVQDVIHNINNSILISNLSAELHLERRTSFSYIIDKTTSAELILQRNQTDAALKTLESKTEGSINSYLKYSMLNELKTIRNQVLRKQISPRQSLHYYSNVLNRVHSFYNTSVENIHYLNSISQDLVAERLIFNIINQFGELRALIYSAASKRTYSQEDLNEIQKLLALTYSYTDEFNTKGSKYIVASFNEVNQSENARYISQVLTEIATKKQVPANFNLEKWWAASGSLIDDIIKIQSAQIERTKAKTEQILEQEEKALTNTILLLVAIIILVIFIIAFTIRNITNILNNIRFASEKIALGETSELEVLTNDVIGSLVKSIQIIDINNHQLARAAESIGKGDFDITITPRSKGDILGIAVQKMKEDLQKFSLESSEKIWVQTGMALVNKTIRGEKNIQDLSDNVLNSLVNYIDANVGVMYSCNNETLHFEAGFALSKSYNAPKKLQLGETLIGEAAKQKKILTLQNIPNDILKVTSATVESIPKYILIVPLIHNDIVEGVIEVGSLNAFSDITKSLLEEASNSIAIAIHTSKNRAKLQELLEETQAQSEELQAQHSELEGLNTELEAQAQKLQASEEELKVQHEELIQKNEELEEHSKWLEEKNQLIVERNLDIQKKAEELEISTKYKSEFLANMSHELRTPLNSILLLSRLMYENPEKNLTDEQVEFAQVIQSSGNGLLALIDEILDLSKIEAGKMDLEYADVSIADIASDMKALFNPIAKEKDLEFKVDIDQEIPQKISTDKMRVEQIIKNLISNALKFTAKGGVSLKISPTENPMILQISVSDTGIGIAEEKQHLVFEAFQQADGSTRRKFGGTGLGLSISRELVKLLGGEISLKSEEGKGSVFFFTLPVTKITQNEQKTPVAKLLPVNHAKEQPTIPQETKNLVTNIPQEIPDDRDSITENDKIILIIEDDTNFAKALLTYTQKAGYKGLVAVRGDTGIQMAAMYNPLAILLDIQLPIKDGWEVMQELKSNPATRHIPVHIMSSLEVKKESLIKGAVDFINKPIALEQMQQMFEKLEEALNKHPKKVLIIEENPKHARALAYYLETFNVTSEVKGSVTECIETLLKDAAECVILDMGIPDQNAYETLDQIKQHPGLENIPIIIFTGKNLSKAEESRLKYYADSIVMKTAHSYQRILDEVALFLHLVEEKESPKEKKSQNLVELNEVLAGKTVLIADDDVRNIFSLTKALEQLKMKVLSATDGSEALKVLDENPQTDVVLMDMMMPEMDGYESTKKIRKNPRFRNLPILAVTAKAMVGDREKCIQAGASDYISKPVDIDQLISLLRVWLYYKAV